jgi:nicotinate-nucleotide pyrophosphorylase (carboxylating)
VTLQPIALSTVEEVVLAALDEDGASRDVTTQAVVGPAEWGRGVFIAKQPGVVAGMAVAATAMTIGDDSVSFDEIVHDGAYVESGTVLAEVEGRLTALLSSERVALNFLQRLSGIATLTRAFVDAVDGTGVRILDTRKTTPGLREFERFAVRAGGGVNHRFNLADGVLIKDNHIAAARERGMVSLGELIAQARTAVPHTLRIEIEVSTVEEAREAADGGADVILLDNMTPETARQCVEAIAGRAVVEASGGVTLDSVRALAETGVQLISVGALTHSAPALDISLDLQGV